MPDPWRVLILVVVAVLGALFLAPQLEKRFDRKSLIKWLLFIVVGLAICVAGFALFLATRG